MSSAKKNNCRTRSGPVGLFFVHLAHRVANPGRLFAFKGDVVTAAGSGTPGFFFSLLKIRVSPKFAKRRISRILAGEKLRR